MTVYDYDASMDDIMDIWSKVIFFLYFVVPGKALFDDSVLVQPRDWNYSINCKQNVKKN